MPKALAESDYRIFLLCCALFLLVSAGARAETIVAPEGKEDRGWQQNVTREIITQAILRGEALVILRRFTDAKRAFSAAMIADASLAAPLYGLGEANRLSGDKERARYYFKMYVQSRAADVSPALVARAKKFLAQ